MTLVRLMRRARRHLLAAIAILAVAALASQVLEPASAAPARHGTAARFGPPPTSQSQAMPVPGALHNSRLPLPAAGSRTQRGAFAWGAVRASSSGSDSQGPLYQCLYNSYQHCSGDYNSITVDPQTIEDIHAIIVGVVTYLIIKIIEHRGGGGSSLSFQVLGFYPSTPKGWYTGGCMGAWGYGQHLHEGSCKSKHGIYWEAYGHNPHPCCEYYLWNTYSRGYLVTDEHLHDTDGAWIGRLQKGRWETWGDYFA